MNVSRLGILFVGLLLSIGWCAAASGRAINEKGVQIADSDAVPGIGFEWESSGPVEEWSVDGSGKHKDHDKWEMVAHGGQPPTMSPDGSWHLDSSFFDFSYEIQFELPSGEIVPTTGTGVARIVGSAPPSAPGDPVRTFDTEMLYLSLSGDFDGAGPAGPFTLRESPTLASTGQTRITDLGVGQYRIESFFDIFTELSLDGGQTWTPGVPVPEPTTMVLAALGLLGLYGAARRRR